MCFKGLVLFLGLASASAGLSQEMIAPSQPLVTVTPAMVPISREEKGRIYSEFKKKLIDEERAFERLEKARRRDLVKRQNERRKLWREKERVSRKVFFETHSGGPERRRYVQDFVRRKKEFDSLERQEWIEFKKKQKEDRHVFRLSEQERTRKVNAALEKNLRPDLD